MMNDFIFLALSALAFFTAGTILSLFTIPVYWRRIAKGIETCESEECLKSPTDHVNHRAYGMVFFWPFRLPHLIITNAVENRITSTEPITYANARLERKLREEIEAAQPKLRPEQWAKPEPGQSYPTYTLEELRAMGYGTVADDLERIAFRAKMPPKPKPKLGPFDPPEYD